jgi:hypothetical protein
MQKVSRKNLKFWCFSKIGCICRSIEKVSKMTPKSRAHLCTLFFSRNFEAGWFFFLQLRIEVKFRVTFDFLEKISCLFFHV